MENHIVIRSYENGISIYLDSEIPFEELLEQIAVKFREGKHFFRNMKTAVSFEGRSLTIEEEKQIISTIYMNSKLEVLCIIGKEEDSINQHFNTVFCERYMDNEESGSFYRGSLKKGQVLELESSIVILGDVNFGCKVTSKKDIIILGALKGAAHAGVMGDSSHYVVALEMEPRKLKIGDCTYVTNEKKSKWRRKPKIEPKIAYMKENKIYMKTLTKELLNEISI